MNLGCYIAWRYLHTPTKRTFIHRLSFFSMGMVAVGTMALIVALSAFNGMKALLQKHYASFDPALSIRSARGYTFSFTDSLATYLEQNANILDYSPVLEDYVLASYRGKQEVVKLRGLRPDFLAASALRAHLQQGTFSIYMADEPYALIGVGVQQALLLPLYVEEAPSLQFFYPTEKISFDPRSLYHSRSLPVAGTFAINRFQDQEYVLVPLFFARALIGDSSRCSSVALRLSATAMPEQVAQGLQRKLGDTFRVLTREQQHSSLYRLLRIEKFFVFLVFGFILVVASLGLFFVLLMLFLDKRRDLALLVALGARPSLLRSIFVWAGLWVSTIGGSIGLALSVLLCYLQQRYQLISLGMANSTAAYPIEVHISDITLALSCVMGLTLLSALRPAWLAGKYKDLLKPTGYT